MIRKFKASGTVLYGRAMMAQLASEIIHLKVEKPVVVAQNGFERKAWKVALLFNSGLFGSIPVVVGDAPEDFDFLILAGGRVLTDHFSEDIRFKAHVPLNNDHLMEINEPGSDFIVLDSAFVKNKSILTSFLKAYANSISDGLTVGVPVQPLPKSFVFSCKTSVFSGADTLEILPRLIEEKQIKKPLLLTDKGIVSAGLLEYITNELKNSFPVIYSDIPADSNMDVVNEISSIYIEKECDAIIAFGGGSVLDTGKGVYLNVGMGNSSLKSMVGSGRISRIHIPFFAIPTTSGTGSEVTKVAVISDPSSKRKLLFNSTNLQPDIALLDSRLTVSLPPHLTSITGMDALTHAIEAYTCIGKNPLSDYLSWTAIELIRDHLLGAIDNPENLEYRNALALASNMAGQAFSNSMVGMVHTIGHSVGAVCHAPHGSCMSVLLPHALEYNRSKIDSLLSELLLALAGSVVYENTPEEERPDRLISEIVDLNKTLKEKTGGRHPESLRDIKNRDGVPLVSRDDFSHIAEASMGDASIVYNPLALNIKDILGVLERCY